MPTPAQVPFSEPPWLMGLPSAYYNDSHRKWQRVCRAFVDETMMPFASEWERDGDVPGLALVTCPKSPFLTFQRGLIFKIRKGQFLNPKSLSSITCEVA
jgi:hypothetical protein